MTYHKTMQNLKSPNQLEDWASSIEGEMSDLESQLLPLKARLEESRRELDLVNQLIQLRREQTNLGTSIQANVSRAEADSENGVNPPSLEDHVERLLAEAGNPMHVTRILESLRQNRVPVPGRGEEANIIVRLRRDSGRFVRTNRGTYGLKVRGISEMRTRRRMAKKRRT